MDIISDDKSLVRRPSGVMGFPPVPGIISRSRNPPMYFEIVHYASGNFHGLKGEMRTH
jgi:hypothetical protein